MLGGLILTIAIALPQFVLKVIDASKINNNPIWLGLIFLIFGLIKT